MPLENSERSVHFPTFEKKQRKPICHWQHLLKGLVGYVYRKPLAH